jgi:hypothetical protein
MYSMCIKSKISQPQSLWFLSLRLVPFLQLRVEYLGFQSHYGHWCICNICLCFTLCRKGHARGRSSHPIKGRPTECLLTDLRPKKLEALIRMKLTKHLRWIVLRKQLITVKMWYFPSVASVLRARYRKVSNVRVWILPHDKVSVRVKMKLYSVLSEVTRQLCQQTATGNMLQTDNQKLHVLGQPPYKPLLFVGKWCLMQYTLLQSERLPIRTFRNW